MSDHVQTQHSAIISHGDITMNTGSMHVVVNGALVDLTGRQCQVLLFLIRNSGKTVTKDMIMTHLYGPDTQHEPEPKIIDVFICQLRKKLHIASGKHLIDTVWGRGYRMAPAA